MMAMSPAPTGWGKATVLENGRVLSRSRATVPCSGLEIDLRRFDLGTNMRETGRRVLLKRPLKSSSDGGLKIIIVKQVERIDRQR